MATITESIDELVADWAPVEDRRAAAHATSLGVRVWFLRRQRIWESPSLCCRRCSFCCPRQKMTPLFCCCPCNTPLVSPQMPSFYLALPLRNSLRIEQISVVARINSEFLSAVDLRSKHQVHWGFVGASRIQYRPKVSRIVHQRRAFRPSACWLTSSQIANDAFTWGTVSVLPFYTLMVLAPNAALTRRSMESNLPYVVLGVVYAYLLYLSWTPDTFSTMFASKYWLPELSGIAKMFSNEMTMASAWIHLLAVDLFAARQVFHDGLKNNVETRHSVSLCLLFCPVGIFSHFITKSLTKTANRPH